MRLPLIHSLGLVPDPCTPGPPAPRPPYRPEDANDWLLDRIWYASWLRPLQPRRVIQRLRTRWPPGDFGGWRDQHLTDLLADLDIQLVPGRWGSPHHELLVRHRTGDHVSHDHARYRVGLGGPPLPRESGEREEDDPTLVWPSTNLLADVGIMRRVRQRLDQPLGRPYPPAGTKPNLVIADDLARLGHPAVRLDQIRDLSRLAWEAVQLHYDLLSRCIYDADGFIDFAALSSQPAVSLTHVELPYDRYRDDASAIVRWLAPAVVDACNRRRVTRTRATPLSTIMAVERGATGRMAKGVEIALYGGVDEDGTVTLVRTEPRLYGSGGKRPSIRRLLCDPDVEPANLLAAPEQVEERLTRVASAGFDVVLDGQARWFPPERLGPVATKPDGPVVEPVAIELTGMLSDLCMRVVQCESIWTAEGLRQLAETGWSHRGLLPRDLVARGVSRGLLRPAGRSGGIELAAPWQLRRLAIRTILTVPATRPGGLHPPLHPSWSRGIKPIVDYFVRLAWLARTSVAGRMDVVRALTTILVDGYATERVLRPVLPVLLGHEGVHHGRPSVEPLSKSAMYGPARKRGERYQLALSIEQRVRWFRAWRPDLDIGAVEQRLAPYVRAMAVARTAAKPQTAKVEAAMDAVRQAHDGASVAEVGRAARLNRRPEVVDRYVGAGLLIAAAPDTLGSAADKLRWARR